MNQSPDFYGVCSPHLWEVCSLSLLFISLLKKSLFSNWIVHVTGHIKGGKRFDMMEK